MLQDSVIEDLVTLLKPSTRTEVRVATLRHVSGLTSDDDGISFITKQKSLLTSILSRLKDEVDKCALLAYSTLINITATEEGANCIITDFNLLDELITNICDPESRTADEAAKLLINLTRSGKGARNFLKSCTNRDCTNDTSAEYAKLEHLIGCFSKVGYNKHAHGLDHVAFTLANVTAIVEGRKYFCRRVDTTIRLLLPFLKHDSAIRREGIAMTIKNCCFEHDWHEKLLGEDLELLSHLMLPLAGGDEFSDEENDSLPLDLQYLPEDKKRESKPIIRYLLVETLLLLCADQFGRNFLKKHGVYYIIRQLHMWELDHGLEENAEQCENLVQILHLVVDMTFYRPFTCFDLLKLNRVNLDPLTETYGLNFYLQYLSKWPEFFTVAETPSGEMMAYIMGKVEGRQPENWHGHVTAVTVAPEYRRLGLAAQLMRKLEDESEQKRGYFVDLFVRKSNDIAVGMYKQLGYSIYRTVLGYYSSPNGDKDEDAYDMRKALSRDIYRTSIIPLKDPVKTEDLE